MGTNLATDASKVPPSQFQKRKGSIYSTGSSRDGHVHGSGERDKAYFEKLKQKVCNQCAFYKWQLLTSASGMGQDQAQ